MTGHLQAGQPPPSGAPPGRRISATTFARETTHAAPIRTEFRKITTVRSPWLLLAGGLLIVAAGITGLVESGGNVHDPAVQRAALGHVALAAILTLIFGILAVAGEYRHGTITDTFLSFPRRGRVVGAKLALYALVGAGAGLVQDSSRWPSPPPGGKPRGAHSRGGGGTWRTVAGGVAVNAAFAAIGVGLGRPCAMSSGRRPPRRWGSR